MQSQCDSEKIEENIIFLRNKLTGANSLLVSYLPSSIINGGVNTIRNTDNNSFFKKYTEDIFILPINRLIDWPTGFYKNKETTDTQLLINSKKFIICFDGLPNNILEVKVSINSLNEYLPFINYKCLTLEELVNVVCDLENSLRSSLVNT